jgi:hypothetical protein
MNESYSAGANIEAWCPVCKLQSSHTIISIVDNLPRKVKCTSCDEHHNLSAKQSGKSRAGSKSVSRKLRAKEKTYEKYLSRLTGGDPANSMRYTIKGNFEKDQVIDHLKFGIGIVLSVIQINKIEILFKDGPRLLIQNQ